MSWYKNNAVYLAFMAVIILAVLGIIRCIAWLF